METFSSRISSKSQQIIPFLYYHGLRLLPLTFVSLFLLPSFVNAQSQSPTYWQYSAAGRLHHVLTADINHDSVEEVLVVDENGKLNILSSDGVLQWNFTAQEPVTAINTVNINGLANPEKEIVLGAKNRLILLAPTGEEIWQSQVTSFSPPISLLTSGGREEELQLISQLEAIPVSITPFDQNKDGNQELLILLQSGQLLLYDTKGHMLWRHSQKIGFSQDLQPEIVITDLNNDGQNEIALGFFDPNLRFSQLVLIDNDGQDIWDQPQSVSGRITTLSLTTFSDKKYIVVGNNLGQVSLYDSERQRLWLRTLNKPITSLANVQLTDGPGLVIGTNAGSVVGFDEQGRRVWTKYLSSDGNRSIIALSASPILPSENQPALSAIVQATENADEPADVILLASNGRTINTIEAVDTTGLTRLTDVNHDKNIELLLTRFAQVELWGLGLGANETAKEWDYNLFSEPRSILVVDIDKDGTDELIIGTQDGRIHSLDNNKTIRWLHAPGGAITHLAALMKPSNELPDIVAVRNYKSLGLNNLSSYEAWLELRQANGRQIWEHQFSTQINTLVVGDIIDDQEPEIVIGTIDGELFIYSTTGNLVSKATINSSIENILILKNSNSDKRELIATSKHQIFNVTNQFTPWRIAFYSQEIFGIYPDNQQSTELTSSILVILDDGTLENRVVSRGVQPPKWNLNIGGTPTKNLTTNGINGEINTEGATQSFVITTNPANFLRLNFQDETPITSWPLTALENITSLYWTDLDGDALPEIVIGNLEGNIRVYRYLADNEPEQLVDLDLSSGLLAITALRRGDEPKSDLLAITENGLVQLFRAQENLPPLLTNPAVDATQNQYSFVVSVHDLENDVVNVQLEILDPTNNEWIPQDNKELGNGKGTVFWLVNDRPVRQGGINYRFHYDDGFHQGYIIPPIGPPIPTPIPSTAATPRANLIILGVVSLIFVIILIRQSQLPSSRTRRFYRHLKQQPQNSLEMLDAKYTHTKGSPDYLLYLANQARQRKDSLIASFADGLFLLADQPHAGLPIIIRALDEASVKEPRWKWIDRWQMTCKTCLTLLEAPTVTELTLLQPQLPHLLNELDKTDHWSPALEALAPVLTNLRDSERVDLVDDRLVYLNEAAVLLNQLREQFNEFPMAFEKTIAQAIMERWSGLVSAEIEDLRGRAELNINLKTKLLAPVQRIDVVMEINNNGRAAAENIIAELDDDPAYDVLSPPEVIPILPPGRNRQIIFTIEPKVSDRFRIALNVTFDDRNGRDKAVAFGDMVRLLPPVHEFQPIPNPYLPGTPLRSNSPIFYGRKELFNFIAENAGDLTQRNVLILVGERRTGKTSILLRLDQHLPNHLLPVYIDCQSLGVISGMPALLHDLAWFIADALATRGIDVNVPEPAVWQDDPTGRFQRHFLPFVKSLIPPTTTLLLVFDEFEAFENLVDDGILPPTLFPYLRHLMQHSDQLSFVFVGTRRLEEMSADYWSVLFNIALYQRIGYLSQESATQLICEPVKPYLIYDDLALDKILRVTTGHPYFLQLVCYTLVKRANTQRSGYATISDVNAALGEMLNLGEVHFAYLWQRSTSIERTLLTAIAHLMDRDQPFHPADLVQYLEPYGIQLTPAEVTTALNRLVARDILREVTEEATTLYELKIGLVGLWVARYKSLTTLLTGNGDKRTAAPSSLVTLK